VTRLNWLPPALVATMALLGTVAAIVPDPPPAKPKPRAALGSRAAVGDDLEPPTPLPNPDLPPVPPVDPPAPPRPTPGPEWGIVELVVFDVMQQHDNSGGIIRLNLYDGISRRWPAYVHTKLPNSSITWNAAPVTPWELAGNLITQRSQVTYWPVAEYRAGAIRAEFSTFP
jgi:hypothetical protein